jgi:hypothetical protein
LLRHRLPEHLYPFLSRYGREHLYLEQLTPVHPYRCEGGHAFRFHDRYNPRVLGLQPILTDDIQALRILPLQSASPPSCKVVPGRALSRITNSISYLLSVRLLRRSLTLFRKRA